MRDEFESARASCEAAGTADGKAPEHDDDDEGLATGAGTRPRERYCSKGGARRDLHGERTRAEVGGEQGEKVRDEIDQFSEVRRSRLASGTSITAASHCCE